MTKKCFLSCLPETLFSFCCTPKHLLPAKSTDLESSHWVQQVRHVQSTGWSLWDNLVSPIHPSTGFLHMYVCLSVCGHVCMWGWCKSTCVPLYVAAQSWHWVSSSVTLHSTQLLSQDILKMLQLADFTSIVSQLAWVVGSPSFCLLHSEVTGS